MRMRGSGRPSTGIVRRGDRVHARPKGGREGARRVNRGSAPPLRTPLDVQGSGFTRSSCAG
eukprot:336188-Prymnesium_polylepis.1